MNIEEIIKKHTKKIGYLDLELILSRAIHKPREFVLSHPEFEITKNQEITISKLIARRIKGEPLAYILGNKEFYGLDFKVDKNVLIPRPETEILTEAVMKKILTIKQSNNLAIVDIGTGCGNIIISVAENLPKKYLAACSLLGADISQKALNLAKLNAKKYGISKSIKFFRGDLLKPLVKNNHLKFNPPAGGQNLKFIIIANLPYVSASNYKKFYNQIKFEPRSALLSKTGGLAHYDKLFQQLKKIFAACCLPHTALIIEFSPEQKNRLNKLINKYFPNAKINFRRDLAGKWRVCTINC